MERFPVGIQFCYEWRSYQRRILNELDGHLLNGHLHLVAPPGSGKTVLGLEVMFRLDQPTLIVVPTVAIREQWVERFTELFLGNEKPVWVSTSLKEPGFVTVTTYQSLHSLFGGRNDKSNNDGEDQIDDELIEDRVTGNSDEVIRRFEQMGFGTLVLDEAHHLRTSWWRTMIEVKSRLVEPVVVALTATPPFDVSASEWQRYVALCGPIDLEISVPELVKSSELCPHQDFIHYSIPEADEMMRILEFREDVDMFIQQLNADKEFLAYLEKHPWIAEPEAHVEEILSSPGVFSAMLLFLKNNGSPAYLHALPIIGMKEGQMPELTLLWLEELLTGLLFHLEGKETILKSIRMRLTRIGAVERRKVVLLSNASIKKALIHSASKLKSIEEIVKAEKNVLDDQLRMVILTDYIRLEDMPLTEEDELPFARLGVVPIFEMVRRKLGHLVKPGILTGSIVVLPESALPLFDEVAKKQGLTVVTTPLEADASFIRIEVSASNRQQMVAVMTEVLNRGGVDVLTGTAALLGEGWDAPCINSLIMASYVGSFMLSNQMRGRAIRTDRHDLTKTSSIWHLVCVDRNDTGGGTDYENLTRRFRSLIGIGAKRAVIETGIARLETGVPPVTAEQVDELNREMHQRAGKRNTLFDRWQKAIDNGREMTEEIVAQKRSLPRPYYLDNTLKGLAWITGFIALEAVFDFSNLFRNLGVFSFKEGMTIAAALGLLFAAPSLYRTVKLYSKHPSVESSMKEIAETLYVSMHHAGAIKIPFHKMMIRITNDGSGYYTCWLDEGTTQEKTVFMNALKELLDPIENPRYILIRKAGKLWKRTDYHAIPQVIGQKKEYVNFFLKEWAHRVGKADFIYTRTAEGRLQLLEARMKALSITFVPKAERTSGWR
ncbi:MAG TPA: DEAD/DEAH box helicase family protein [Sporosarcina psychrophila]|uniref:DEAD/DEAH box helicase family protein n=1 Tax=Sporosarcina psychrophila TaxID=1476 RepID=A0A921G136_SPOPS|nr:DEAD/DEAH box helicase family protein [Sporosarcina psychrophila]